MAYGAVGDWCNHLKNDWKKGRRFVPIIEIVLASGLTFLFVVGIVNEARSLFSLQIPTTATTTAIETHGDRSPIFTENATVTGSFNNLFVDRQFVPHIDYVVEIPTEKQPDGLYYTTYELTMWDGSDDVAPSTFYISEVFTKCFSVEFKAVRLRPRSALVNTIECSSEEPPPAPTAVTLFWY